MILLFGVMIALPTKASPAGCIVALFGLLSVAYGILSGYQLLILLIGSPDGIDTHVLWTAIVKAALGLMMGLWLCRLGWRLAASSDMTEPYSPDKPKMRF